MEDSGAILAHISSLKEMLDQVNEEMEANIEITREIESSIVKCEEIEADLATREADLIKTSAILQFDTVGYVTVAALQVQIQRSTWENEKLLKDISDLKTTLLSAIGTSDDGQ
ncbi:uncharacterized protein LOC114170546 [Vigna unguiculata]|uniref:uncharacterized protein LOC114170546 n=1 Tax=Vigna unguiculata TaxID=3917 RepID=UPI0010162E1E|nr:uncharacterized protein LOC114170546 [Vigna unguiculata]